MADQRAVMRVFLGSPGDLIPERRAAKRVCDEVNINMANPFDIHVELVGWEETVTSFGRPQELINQDLDQCHIFFGVVWKRWGTPPDVEGKYRSGFEEEFERCMARRNSGDHLDVGMFFKDVDPDSLKDPGDQLKTVIAFRERLIAEKKVYFETFVDTAEFESRFRRAMYARVRGWISTKTSRKFDDATSVDGDGEKKIDRENSALPEEVANFFSSLIEPDADERKSDLDKLEVARLRLVSSCFGGSGNDEIVLQVHDANLIYRHLERRSFSTREQYGFIRAALSHLKSEVIPFWSWSQEMARSEVDPRIVQSYIGPTKARIGAINAIAIVDPDWPSSNSFSRDEALQYWFGSDDADVRSAAVRYLDRFGNEGDLPLLDAEIERAASATLSSAINAAIAIRLQSSPIIALDSIRGYDPASADTRALSVVDSAPKESAPTLRGLLSAKDSKIRARAAARLRELRVLSVDDELKLFGDSSASVRLQGLLERLSREEEVSVDEAKKIIVKTRKVSRLLGSASPPSEDEKEALSEFKRSYFARVSDDLAQQIVAGGDLANFESGDLVMEANFRSFANAIEASVRDGFKGRFDEIIEGYRERCGTGAEALISGWLPLETEICRERCRSLAGILSRQAKTDAHLDAIRIALDKHQIEFEPDVIEYIGAFGGNEDIDRIIAAFHRPNYSGLSLLLSEDNAKRSLVSAEAILKIRGREVNAITSIELPAALLADALKFVTDASIRRLEMGACLDLLSSDDERVRKVLALRLVSVWPKVKLRELRTEYFLHRDGIYFYNVVFWLDFGIGVSSAKVKACARQLI